MERFESLNDIALTMQKMVCTYGRRNDIAITAARLTDETISAYTAWQRSFFQLHAGEEVFMVWEITKAESSCLLYVINVTGDSLLTAAGELMELLSRKF